MNVARREDRTLERIVAILVALAVLAERASGMSLPVRLVVLSLLRAAETVARGFVAEFTQTPWPCADDLPETRNGRADVMLAARFRALAAALGALLSPAWRHAWRTTAVDDAHRFFAPRPGRPAVAPGGWWPRPNDTS